MQALDLARAVAQDLGDDVVAQVNMGSTGDASRGVGEAVAVGGFLLQCAHVAIQLWQAKQDRALLVAALENSDELMKAYPLDPEKRLGLTARILNRLLPSSFDPSSYSIAEKQRWVSGMMERRRNDTGAALDARGFDGVTILLPFADQFWWILYQPVGWVPGPEDGPDVVRVDVPRGFVTDLASIPSYLWAVLQKTGRYGNAAIYHDWLYWEQSVPRATADRIFDRAMHDMGVDQTSRRLIWSGVRVFGGKYWDQNTAAKLRGEKRVLAHFPDSPTVKWDDWRTRPGVFL